MSPRPSPICLVHSILTDRTGHNLYHISEAGRGGGGKSTKGGLSSVGDSLLSGNSQPVSPQQTHNHSDIAATVEHRLPSPVVCIGSKTFHNLIMHMINSKVASKNVHSAQPYEKIIVKQHRQVLQPYFCWLLYHKVDFANNVYIHILYIALWPSLELYSNNKLYCLYNTTSLWKIIHFQLRYWDFWKTCILYKRIFFKKKSHR